MSLQAAGGAGLARLAGERCLVCRGAWQDLRALSRSDRAALLAKWIVETSSPFPPGTERLHPSWLAQAIASEPVELWPGLLLGLPGVEAVESLLSEAHGAGAIADEAWAPESVAELQRCVFGRLAPFCVGPSGPVGAGLCRLGSEELLAEIVRRGARAKAPSDGDKQTTAAPSSNRTEGRPDAERLRAEGLAAIYQELCVEGDASLWAVAGRLPATLGRQWVKW